jgi:hypothetical protein
VNLNQVKEKFKENELNLLALLFIGFFHITQGLKFLSNIQSQIICLFFLVIVFFNSHHLKFKSFAKNKIILIHSLSTLITALFLLIFGVIDEDTHALRVAYLFFISLFFIYLLGTNFSNYNNSERHIKYYCLSIFLLSLLNIATFIQVTFFHLNPIFNIEYGTIQPRIYEHYFSGVLAEPARFISYFGEPSDLVWISASGFFLLLKFNFYFMAMVCLFSIIISGSGSTLVFLFFLICFIFFKVFFEKKIKYLNIILGLVLIFFIVFLFSELTLYKMFFRWFNFQENKIHVAKIDYLISGLNNKEINENFRLYSFYPTVIEGNTLLNYTNNFFYTVARLGILSILFVSSSFIIFMHSIRKAFINKEYEFLLCILCFLSLLITREAFQFIFIFWFIYFAISLEYKDQSHD